MTTLDDATLRETYAGEFKSMLANSWKDWRDRYLRHVQRIQSASREEWLKRHFQESLWDNDAVTTVGSGRSVTVEGAYVDTGLANSLFEARQLFPGGSAEDRGVKLQSIYDQTLITVQ